MSRAERKIRRRQRRRIARAERLGVSIDGGIGAAAMAAILGRPPGPMRAFEASLWARRAIATVERVAVVVEPGAGDDWVDAHAELMIALHRERERECCSSERGQHEGAVSS